MRDPGTTPKQWQQLMTEASNIAEEYREEGWTATLLRPGDITIVNKGDRRGVSVLLPSSHYEEVQQRITTGVEIDGSDVFRRESEGQTLAIVVFVAEQSDWVLIVPLEYSITGVTKYGSMIDSDGRIAVHLRKVNTDEWITFFLEDPSLLGFC